MGATPHCGALACHHGGFFCGSQALGHTAFSSCGAWAQLLHGRWDLPGPRIEICVPSTSMGIPIHCTTREIPGAVLTRAPYTQIQRQGFLWAGGGRCCFRSRMTNRTEQEKKANYHDAFGMEIFLLVSQGSLEGELNH